MEDTVHDKNHSSNNNILIDPEEIIRQGEAVRKEFEKNMERLETLVKLIKCDIDESNKKWDIIKSSYPHSASSKR